MREKDNSLNFKILHNLLFLMVWLHRNEIQKHLTKESKAVK